MILGKETLEMITIFDYLRVKKLDNYIFHIANERKTSAYGGSILKRMGVKPGVSDIFVAIPRKPYHGMFLEVKAGKNKPTNLQENFIKNMGEQGYYAIWCLGAKASIEAIEAYLLLKND